MLEDVNWGLVAWYAAVLALLVCLVLTALGVMMLGFAALNLAQWGVAVFGVLLGMLGVLGCITLYLWFTEGV